MAQSLSRIHVHVVFATKHRKPLLTDAVRESLHSYLAVVLTDLGCQPTLVNSVEDHVHVLLELARTVAVSTAVEVMKKSSSKWIKGQGPEFSAFAWQAGYGAFSVSESNLLAVRDYVADQRAHHRKQSFQDEFRALLTKHGVSFDEHYVWD